jgi:uncharacterized membrane protein YgcG
MRKLAIILLLMMFVGIFLVATSSASTPVSIEILHEVERDVGFKVAVVIGEAGSTEAQARQFAQQIFDSEFGANTEGVLLLINRSPSPKYHYIYYSNTNIFNAQRVDQILDYIWDALIAEDYRVATDRFSNRVRHFARQGSVRGSSGGNTGTMIIIMIIATVITIPSMIFGVRAAYKIRPAKCANEYLIQNSVNYRQKSDTYIRTRVTKVKIQSNSGGSSGGGRSSGGGGRRA